MARIEAKLAALGLVLPPQLVPPGGAALPFRFVHLRGNRALISGHGPLAADGTVAQPLGKVGRDLTLEQGYSAARLTGLAILGSLQRALGDLDRITAWGRIFGMVNSAPGFDRQPAVINGSDLILGSSAPGVAPMPGVPSAWPNCVRHPGRIEGEVEFRNSQRRARGAATGTQAGRRCCAPTAWRCSWASSHCLRSRPPP
jgi:hypothetical protein